jgi:hypothetical protein
MGFGSSRMDNEQRTVEAMVSLYCHAHHGRTEGLCDACISLAAYARQRLAGCIYQGNKPTCGRCPIHCYKPEMRKKIQEVMRYSGPRMLWRHPILAIIHLRDRLRKIPPHPRKTPVRQR